MENILQFNLTAIDQINAASVMLSTVTATFLGLFIILVYRFTYSGVVYNPKFATALGMITVITALVMNVISNNIALSLGLVGALSIIRFRTVVKDIVDASYLFWAISIGIACGVFQYIPAVIVSINLVVLQLLLKRFKQEGVYLLVIRSQPDAQTKVIATVNHYFNKNLKQRVRNCNQDYGDVIFEVGQSTVNKMTKKHGVHILDKLRDVAGVVSVDLVEHTDNLMH